MHGASCMGSTQGAVFWASWYPICCPGFSLCLLLTIPLQCVGSGLQCLLLDPHTHIHSPLSIFPALHNSNVQLHLTASLHKRWLWWDRLCDLSIPTEFLQRVGTGLSTLHPWYLWGRVLLYPCHGWKEAQRLVRVGIWNPRSSEWEMNIISIFQLKWKIYMTQLNAKCR